MDGLEPESDAVSMRAFGTGQLAGTTWDEVQAWIAPITAPTHAGDTGADGAAFWSEFAQVAELQTVRRDPAARASDHLVALPYIFAEHTVAAGAAEVESDCKLKYLGHSSSSRTRIAKSNLGDPLASAIVHITARRPLECTVWLTRSLALPAVALAPAQSRASSRRC